MRLADVQQRLRRALVEEVHGLPEGMLVGGVRPSRRFEIHRWHYEHSLTTAVTGRFPATGWLIGPMRLEAAARAYVRESPPSAPCIVEYGHSFPGFLEHWSATAHLAYVPAFAELDWHLGRLAVSVNGIPAGLDRLLAFSGDELGDLTVALQPGLHYLQSEWDVDTLIQCYLTDAAPPEWTLRQETVRLQIRGTRGSLQFARQSASDFAFRASLAGGATCETAMHAALTHDRCFDAGTALLALAREGLIVDVTRAEPRQ